MPEPPITSALYKHRGLFGHSDPDGSDVAGWPEVAADAIRATAHLTGNGQAIPGPLAYQVLAHLANVALRLSQTLDHLGDGRRRSLSDYPTAEDAGGDPAATVEHVQELLAEAARAARQLTALLEQAHGALAGQSYDNTGPAA